MYLGAVVVAVILIHQFVLVLLIWDNIDDF